ncbi:Rab GTPase [Tieghemostelium lacteum]|uniref:Rab GTPase n=1 Tax=Tieghemostelium lacteum TaxID=361077 RepID=A0A151Z472_TIELA|nr:Rab GTPase [Tieghemostelium lacteum]|eukprot:KYQ88759.1 Rab GTPase [Tieghemostelium lacteum]
MGELNVVFVGDQCGKSSLVNRISNDTFNIVMYSTPGLELTVKTVTTDLGDLKVLLFDTSNNTSKFFVSHKLVYRKANAVCLVFDLANINTFRNLSYWLREISELPAKVKLYLVGNKCDLCTVSEEYNKEIEYFATINRFQYFECSAKDTIGTIDLFNQIINDYLTVNPIIITDTNSTILVKNEIKSNCCY